MGVRIHNGVAASPRSGISLSAAFTLAENSPTRRSTRQMPATFLVRGISRPIAPAISNSPVRYMTQRPLGKGAGIIAAKSYFMLEKWLKPVNRNMITKAERPASLQEERRLTPSQPKPRRKTNEISRTNRDTMCLLSGRAGDLPSAYAATLVGSLACCRVTSPLPPSVTTGRGSSLAFCRPCSTSFALPAAADLLFRFPVCAPVRLQTIHTSPALLRQLECRSLGETSRSPVPSATMARSRRQVRRFRHVYGEGRTHSERNRAACHVRRAPSPRHGRR